MKKILFIFLILFVSCAIHAQIQKPVKWAIDCSEINADNTITLTFKADIEKGWHIYGNQMPEDGPIPTTFHFTEKKNVLLTGETNADKKMECVNDPLFAMELCEYEESVTFTQKAKLEKEGEGYVINGFVEFMACDNTNCLSPTKESFSFKQKGEAANSQAGSEANKQETEVTPIAVAPLQIPALTVTNEELDTWAPVIDQLNGTSGGEENTGGSLWLIFGIGLLGGFLAVLTPCVWPTISMTISFFLNNEGETENDPKKEGNLEKEGRSINGKLSAIFYGCSIIFIYVGLGLILTLCFGANALNALSTSAVFNLFIFLLLVAFAISFFGGIDLSLPASLSTKLDKISGEIKGVTSILFMALTLVVVSFSCTGPIIGTLLVEVSTRGNILSPAIGMLGFAIALAIPFTFIAIFPKFLNKLPKQGSWMNTVKVLLGFFELAFSLKFLSVADMAYGWGILSRDTFIALWIVIFFLAGLYILGYLRFKDEKKLDGVSVWRLFGGGASLAFAIYLLPGLWGAPLTVVSAFAPPTWTQEFNLHNEVKAQFSDYDDAIAYAKKEGKPILVDFSGYGCVNCRKMEAAVWNAPEVKELIDNEFVLVSLFVDDKHELKAPHTFKNGEKETIVNTIGEKWSYLEEHKFGANSQPFYVIIDEQGKAMSPSYGYSEDVDAFVQFLKNGVNKYKNKQ